MTDVQLGQLAAIATAGLWTLSALAWTSAGKSIGAVSVSFLRRVITCGLLIVYGWVVRGTWLATDATAENWGVLALSGLMGFCLADLCLFKAFLLIGPRLALLIYSISPPLAALISWAALGEQFTGWHWLGMAVTLAGVAWVVLEEPEVDGHPHSARQLWPGVALAVLGAAGQALASMLSKKGLGDCDAVGATYIRVLGGIAGFIVLVTLGRRWPAVLKATGDRRAMGIMVCGAIVGPFVGVICYLVALKHCQVGVVATIISTMPVLILPFVIFVYHEKVSPRAAIGAAISVLGVAILLWPHG
jgi:drug/metabolite transporter (DMT)-like permease